MESLTHNQKLELKKQEDAFVKAFVEERMQTFERMKAALINSNGPLTQPSKDKSIWSRFLEFFLITDTAR